jgi:uncharacterized protein (DUF433 family)
VVSICWRSEAPRWIGRWEDVPQQVRRWAKPVTLATLDRPLYSITEAGRYLGVPSQTLKRWLEGATVKGRFYQPVIRPEPIGSDAVTWAEFVEAGFLREYRGRNVPLQRMRPFIDRARSYWNVPYPLAHFKPMIEGKELVYDMQREADLPPSLYLIRPSDRGGQMQWADPVEQFLAKVDFQHTFVNRLHPQGRQSPVVIDPEVSFGIPQVNGVRTERLGEADAAGEPVEEIAADWGLRVREVNAALDWERSLSRAA